VVKPALRKKVAGYLQERYRISTRRAAENACIARATMYYKKKSDPQVQSLRIAVRDAAVKRPRFGWRRILVLVKREGHHVGEFRLRRIYREEGLSLRQKSPKRRRSAVVRQPRNQATAPNDIWSMDFMHDRLSDGRKFRLFTVVDAFSRECVSLRVAYGFRSVDVITALRHAIAKRGKPRTLRCDNGSEFTSTEFDQWAYWNNIAIDFSRPGKPTDNAFAESFNGRVRQELLNPSWFDTLEQARREAGEWRRDYNEIRPHRSLGNKSPKEFVLARERDLASA
jgi:putative transposase